MRNLRTFLLMREFESHEIGARIALARNEAGGMTQEELGDLVGVTTRSVQNWEGGVSIPYKWLTKISEVLNKPVGWFLHGSEPNDSETEDERLTRLEAQLADANAKIDRLLDLLGASLPPGALFRQERAQAD